jgi:aldose 1-epimerase
MSLTVEADEDMPAMVGWHPWFRKPERSPVGLVSMLRRDRAGIATNECVHRPAGPIDDCFVGRFDGRTNDVDELLTFRVANVDLDLSSDCTHWVLYDEPSHATCVEPQSGPPNQVNDAPVVLVAGESMTRWFRIRMSTS